MSETPAKLFARVVAERALNMNAEQRVRRTYADLGRQFAEQAKLRKEQNSSSLSRLGKSPSARRNLKIALALIAAVAGVWGISSAASSIRDGLNPYRGVASVKLSESSALEAKQAAEKLLQAFKSNPDEFKSLCANLEPGSAAFCQKAFPALSARGLGETRVASVDAGTILLRAHLGGSVNLVFTFKKTAGASDLQFAALRPDFR